MNKIMCENCRKIVNGYRAKKFCSDYCGHLYRTRGYHKDSEIIRRNKDLILSNMEVLNLFELVTR